MGYNITWVGYPHVSKKEALAISGLHDTGAASPELKAPFQAAELPNGWTIVLSNDLRFGVNPGVLSRNHAALLCIVGDTASVYQASYYVRGEDVWEIGYNGFDGPGKLEVSGHPPPELAAVRSRVRRGGGPGSLDEYDVPVEVARAICGFRHDVGHYDWGSPQFTVAKLA